MTKDMQNEIHTIDNLVRQRMSFLDEKHENIFKEGFSLIMNFEPYLSKVVLNRPARTPEHRIMLIVKGHTTINVLCNDYHLSEGDLLIVPANSVLTKKSQSDDYRVYCVAFRIPEVEHLELIDYKPTHLTLSDEHFHLVRSYFLLLNQLSQKDETSQQCISHLIISLLYEMHRIEETESRVVNPVTPSRAQDLTNAFLKLLHSQKYPKRRLDYYAEALHVSKIHLSTCVKKQSGVTASNWITRQVILTAQAMLLEAERTVDKVADAMEFASTSQFTKYFKREVGQTPSDYKRVML